MVVVIVFCTLLVISFVFTCLSFALDWDEDLIIFLVAACVAFAISIGISYRRTRLEKELKECNHTFISCNHKPDEHSDYSICEAYCSNCGKEIGIFTPKEIYEYNLSHR